MREDPSVGGNDMNPMVYPISTLPLKLGSSQTHFLYNWISIVNSLGIFIIQIFLYWAFILSTMSRIQLSVLRY